MTLPQETPKSGEYWLAKLKGGKLLEHGKPFVVLCNKLFIGLDEQLVAYAPGVERFYYPEAFDFIRKINIPELD